MILKWTLLFVCGLVGICQSAFVDTLQKCSITDGECVKDLIQGILKANAETGIEESKIQPFDPIKLKNIPVSVMGLLNITFVDGVAKGVKNCVVDSITTELEKSHSVVELTCDIVIKGRFTAIGGNPLIQNLFGRNGIRGDGNAKVKIDKLHLKLEYFYEFLKKEDGEIYIECHPEKTLYEYSMAGLKISADKIFLGDQDASGLVIPVLNENWKFVIDSFGRSFFDVAMKIFFDIASKFFKTTPTKFYLTDDLTPYVTNQR